MSKLQRKGLLTAALLGLALLALACSGGARETAAPVQQPAASAQPAPAAPAVAPQPAPSQPQQTQQAPLPPSAREPKHGGTARFAIRLDPTGSWDVTQTTIYYPLHQMGAPTWGSGNLVRPCRESVYKVCPGLATSWESNSDFTQWTFKVREGVLWHDGKPFTADDAKFWVELVASGAKAGGKTRERAWFAVNAGLGSLQKAEVLDGGRLRLTLGSPQPFLPVLLAVPFYPIAHPRHLAQPVIERGEPKVSPQDIGWIGTGPFKMAGYEKGSKSEARRNAEYWEKDEKGRQFPYLNSVQFFIIGDPAAEDAAFRVGHLEGNSTYESLTKDRLNGYIRDLGDKVWVAEFPGTAAVAAASNLGFNLLKPGPWQDVRVRKAIALQIDKDKMKDAAGGGFGLVSTMFNPKNPYTSPDFGTWPSFNLATQEQDRREARRLMAEAGYPAGFPMTINCLRTRPWIDRCQYLQDQLRPLGIDLKFDIMDTPQWVLAGKSLSHDALQVSAGIPTWLPEALEGGFTRYSISTGAYSKHEDPKIVEFFDRIKGTSNVEERIRTWRAFERYVLLEQVLVVPTSGQVSALAFPTYVKGRVIPDEGVMNHLELATVWFDK